MTFGNKKHISVRIVIAVLAVGTIFFLGFPLLMMSNQSQGSVSLNEPIVLPFEVAQKKQVLLLYLGYVGCKTICEPSLTELAGVYKQLPSKEHIAVYFVNIGEPGSGAQVYARYFNPNFIGIEASKAGTAQLMHQLHAYSSDSLSGDGSMSHTGYLYLIKKQNSKQFLLKKLYYTRPFDPVSISSDIKKELQ